MILRSRSDYLNNGLPFEVRRIDAPFFPLGRFAPLQSSVLELTAKSLRAALKQAAPAGLL
jgi:hypothetical protein